MTAEGTEGGRWKRPGRARDSMMAAVVISLPQRSRSMEGRAVGYGYRKGIWLQMPNSKEMQVSKTGFCWTKKKKISLLGKEEGVQVGKYLGA